MSAPLTLIVEGKPLVFDVPVPVGEVIPAGTWFVEMHDDCPGGALFRDDDGESRVVEDGLTFTARPPVAPESFADGDVAWVRCVRDDIAIWTDPDGGGVIAGDRVLRHWLKDGTAFLIPSPRPESLADVLDDANLPDELRARIEKAVGA